MAIKSSIKLLAAATVGLAMATGAQAALVTQWSADVSTGWITSGFGEPTFTAGGGTQSISSNLISWGGTGNHAIPGQNATQARSALEIQNGAIEDAAVFTNGAAVPTSTFLHYNNAISANFSTLRTATVLTSLTLTPVSPSGSTLPAFNTAFMIDFIETMNEEPCFAGSASVCDDIFVVSLGDLLTSFDYQGVTYTVGITGDLQPLGDAACAAAGAAAGCFGLQTREGMITAAQFAFNITAQIPEPGVIALLGLGLAGLGVASRRRRAG